MKKNERDRKRLAWKVIFGCSAIGILLLLSLIPFEIIAVPPGNVDSGNYVADNHDTHVAYYNFNDIYTDEEEEYVWDDSGRDKKGFLKNGVSATPEKDDNIDGIDAALSFDGIDQYVHVDSSGDFNISGRYFVISALIKADTCNNPELTICSRGDYGNTGFIFGLESGLLTFNAWNVGHYYIKNTGGNDLRDDEWHYVAVEFFQGTARLYIDPSAGSYGEVTSDNYNLYPGNSTNPFYIGKGQSNSGYFKGDIDFVYFYALESPSFPLTPSRDRMWGMENVGYWPMDEGLIESVPEDRNFINDMVRSDFHSYGIAGDNTGFAGSTGFGNSAPGTHCLQFGGLGSGVMVDDENDYLDFACDPEEDDIYIEFWVMIEDSEGDMMLIEKWDWLEEDSANGYRIYVDYDGLTETYDFKFELACDAITTLTLSGCDPNYWYHLWAWSDGGTGIMNMYYDAHLHLSDSSSTTSTDGIGETDNNLFFATGHPHDYDEDEVDWELVGKMDDVVIGRCYPV